jgi:hypothetical protein
MDTTISALPAGVAATQSSADVTRTRALLASGAVAGLLFVGLVLLQVLTRPGFDLGRHPISLLSLGDLGWIQIANFIVAGLLAMAFAIGVRRVARAGRGARCCSASSGQDLSRAASSSPTRRWASRPALPTPSPISSAGTERSMRSRRRPRSRR